MIQIETPNLNKISEAYFLKVQTECLNRSKFLRLLMRVLFNGRPYTDIENFPLNGNTKKSLANHFLLNANRIADQLHYHTIVPANCKPWITTYRSILELILDFYSDINNLKETILVKPEDSYQKDLDLQAHFGINPTNSPSIYAFMSKVLDYDIFSKHAYWVASELNVNTCPYCNRSYIHTIVSGSSNVIRATFDHFYPHSKHPFLALSFYNLIPSCYFCNSSLKLATSITPSTHLHPYLEGFNDDAKFRIIIASNKPNKSDPENYTIWMQSGMTTLDPREKKIFGTNVDEGNINLFKLNDIYTVHRDIVGELIVKCDKYSSGYTDSLYKFFGLLRSNKAEFYQYYFGNYYDQSDFNRRPLAKMTKDIVSKELPWFI